MSRNNIIIIKINKINNMLYYISTQYILFTQTALLKLMFDNNY